MVRAALLTGSRYGELSRLRCEDVNLDARSIAIRQAKGGKARHVVLTDEGAEFFSSVVAGRKSRDLLLQRTDGQPWKPSQQTRPLKEACTLAKISPAIGFHVLRHTHASMLAMKGVPMGVIDWKPASPRALYSRNYRYKKNMADPMRVKKRELDTFDTLLKELAATEDSYEN